MRLWLMLKKRGKGEAPKGAKRKILCVGSALSASLREDKKRLSQLEKNNPFNFSTDFFSKKRLHLYIMTLNILIQR